MNESLEAIKLPADQIKSTVEADVIVIGAGTSGLITANSAMDEGLDVVLISASTKPISRGGSNGAAYSKAMRRDGYPKMSPWHLQKEILANGNAVDQKKWYKWYNHSEEAFDYVIDFMESRGYKTAFEQSNHLKEDSLYCSPVISHSWIKDWDTGRVSGSQDDLVNEFAQRFTQGGGMLLFRKAGLYFEKENGRVTSVIAKDLETGAYERYKGRKAVVIAAGDFSKDRGLMEKYCPEFVSGVSDAVFDSPVNYDNKGGNGIYRGDLIKAALDAGAAWQKTLPNCAMLNNISNGPTVSRYQNFFGLLLDVDGERFMNEYCSRALGPISQHLAKKGLSFAIWDSTWAERFTWYNQMRPDQDKEKTAKNREEIVAGWDAKAAGTDTSRKALYETGTGERMWYKADTIEELVSMAGLPEKAVKTIKNYNRMCHEGEDLEFHKDPDFMIPVEKGPFYCQKADFSRMNVFTILGGPRTNADMQVCDENDDPIPGLYVVGCAVGDMFAGRYTFMTQGIVYGACCITFGYLTGKYIAKNE